jgi:hypothetical protein
MGYVEYFRILKAIEFICKGERKVYHTVGYNSSSVFSKSFLRVTGFNARLFFYSQLAEHKNVMRAALEVATENPKEAIETIINDVSTTTFMLPKDKKTKKDKTTKQKDKKGQKDKTKQQLKFEN